MGEWRWLNSWISISHPSIVSLHTANKQHLLTNMLSKIILSLNSARFTKLRNENKHWIRCHYTVYGPNSRELWEKETLYLSRRCVALAHFRTGLNCTTLYKKKKTVRKTILAIWIMRQIMGRCTFHHGLSLMNSGWILWRHFKFNQYVWEVSQCTYKKLCKSCYSIAGIVWERFIIK